MEVKTVKEVSNLTGLSETTIYKHIRKENLQVRIVNGIKMITEESIQSFLPKYAPHVLNHSEPHSKQQEYTQEKNLQNSISSEPLQNPLIDKLYKEIDDLKNTISNLQAEKDNLFERLVSLEREQKQEIQKVHNAKDEQLKMYMELLKKQTDNILESQPHQKHSYNKHKDDSHEVEIIEADTEPVKEKMKPKKFFKLLGERGYSEKEIKGIIKQQLKVKDPRFAVVDGKMVIYKDKFNDL
jgi:hypothetical protein